MKSFEIVFLNYFLLLISERIFGNNIEASNETLLSSAGEVDKFPSNYMFSYRSPMQSVNYLNYRVQYGLRYSPNRNLKIKNSEEESFLDTIPKPVKVEEIENEIEESSSVESEILSTQNDLENDEEILSNSTYVDVVESELNATAATDNHSHHIMKPNNRVEYALDFLAERLKRLIFFSSDINQPGNSKLSPHLSTIGRFLSLFNTLKFESFPCVTGRRPLRQLSGTCYNELECLQLGGIVLDRCANGLGVCCVCKRFLV